MNLRDFLYINKIKVMDFAKSVDISRQHLSEIINGKVKPGRRLAKDIEIVTNGCVTAEELLNDKGEENELG